jgi:hypothetical protein
MKIDEKSKSRCGCRDGEQKIQLAEIPALDVSDRKRMEQTLG